MKAQNNGCLGDGRIPTARLPSTTNQIALITMFMKCFEFDHIFVPWQMCIPPPSSTSISNVFQFARYRQGGGQQGSCRGKETRVGHAECGTYRHELHLQGGKIRDQPAWQGPPSTRRVPVAKEAPEAASVAETSSHRCRHSRFRQVQMAVVERELEVLEGAEAVGMGATAAGGREQHFARAAQPQILDAKGAAADKFTRP